MEMMFRLFLSVSATFLPECVSLMMRAVTPADRDTIADCKERHCCENKEKRVLFSSWFRLHKKSLSHRNTNSLREGSCWCIWGHQHWAVKRGGVTLETNCWAGMLKTWAHLQEEAKIFTSVMRFSSQLLTHCAALFWWWDGSRDSLYN